MKLFFYDLETTGLHYWKHGIHQIAGMIVIDNKIKESFDFKVKPYHKAKIEPEALKIANVNEHQIQGYPTMADVHNQLKNILAKYVDKFDKKDKFIKVGYNNAAFDDPFFRAFFVQCNDKYFGSWFWSVPIDVIVLAMDYFKEERPDMKNFKQATVADKLGILIDESKLHDALYDIEICYQIYLKLQNLK